MGSTRNRYHKSGHFLHLAISQPAILAYSTFKVGFPFRSQTQFILVPLYQSQAQRKIQVPVHQEFN